MAHPETRAYLRGCCDELDMPAMNNQTIFDAAWMPDWLAHGPAQTWTALGMVAGVALFLHLVGRRYLLVLLKHVVHRSRVEWDQILYEQKVLHRASLLVPLVVVQVGLGWVPGLPIELLGFLERFVTALMILVGARSISALLSALHEIYLRLPAAEHRPIKSYIQLAQIFVYIVAAIFIIARLADQSPWFFVSGLGAIMAIILLIFRDTLLSLVASVQLTNNDLLRVGDWIEMSQFDADGDVIDIALNNVRVQNWDRTISVIPTHKFLEHSFRNWRGMSESGGRRIKRSIHIDTSTIRFLTDAEIDRLSRFVLLKDYIDTKCSELETYNAAYGDDPEMIVNARRLTNVGTFRAYVINYLRKHPGVNQGMTQIVRQLQPTPEGLPLEIYVFTNNVNWVPYEGIQSDIFDHILAIASEFGLRVYQRPSGYDLKAFEVEAAS
jgi:miniconductance mechanosensitive channel